MAFAAAAPVANEDNKADDAKVLDIPVVHHQVFPSFAHQFVHPTNAVWKTTEAQVLTGTTGAHVLTGASGAQFFSGTTGAFVPGAVVTQENAVKIEEGENKVIVGVPAAHQSGVFTFKQGDAAIGLVGGANIVAHAPAVSSFAFSPAEVTGYQASHVVAASPAVTSHAGTGHAVVAGGVAAVAPCCSLHLQRCCPSCRFAGCCCINRWSRSWSPICKYCPCCCHSCYCTCCRCCSCCRCCCSSPLRI